MIRTLEDGYNLYSVSRVGEDWLLANRNTKTYWTFNQKLEFKNLNKAILFQLSWNDNLYHYTDVHISCHPFLLKEVLWQTDITQYGRDIASHPETGEELWNKPNTIDSALFGYNSFVIVPLKGGQLAALDTKTGHKAWVFEDGRSGFYEIIGDNIYKHSGIYIKEIAAKDGQLIREKVFADDEASKNFIANGEFKVYDDIVVLKEVKGQVCILDRNTFEVLDNFNIEARLPNTNDSIIWHENKLYILDVEHTLHVFERC